ncbi:MAG: hypothetical protein M1281_01355 [Chloroflexi bacterium]|nr:hypothetical protein [Chloroflexota bacterium]
MELPQYVTVAEVQRVCQELGLRDWTAMQIAEVQPAEARLIWDALGVEDIDIPVADLVQGLEVELEHGLRYPDANVTNNHPLLTGKIVLAHLKESLDYYHRLEVAEVEGDLLKVVAAGDIEMVEKYARKLAQAKLLLDQAVLRRFE